MLYQLLITNLNFLEVTFAPILNLGAEVHNRWADIFLS